MTKKYLLICLNIYIQKYQNMYKVYTDGGYKSSTDQGGYASVIVADDVIKHILYFGYCNTTNNRMELRGVLSALEYFKIPTDIEIYSDSAYIVNNYNGGYAEEWLKNKDFTKKNLDLWTKIIDLCKYHNVTFN